MTERDPVAEAHHALFLSVLKLAEGTRVELPTPLARDLLSNIASLIDAKLAVLASQKESRESGPAKCPECNQPLSLHGMGPCNFRKESGPAEKCPWCLGNKRVKEHVAGTMGMGRWVDCKHCHGSGLAPRADDPPAPVAEQAERNEDGEASQADEGAASANRGGSQGMGRETKAVDGRDGEVFANHREGSRDSNRPEPVAPVAAKAPGPLIDQWEHHWSSDADDAYCIHCGAGRSSRYGKCLSFELHEWEAYGSDELMCKRCGRIVYGSKPWPVKFHCVPRNPPPPVPAEAKEAPGGTATADPDATDSTTPTGDFRPLRMTTGGPARHVAFEVKGEPCGTGPSDEELDAAADAATEHFWKHYRELLKGRGSNGSLGDEERRHVYRAFVSSARAPLLAEVTQLRQRTEVAESRLAERDAENAALRRFVEKCRVRYGGDPSFDRRYAELEAEIGKGGKTT